MRACLDCQKPVARKHARYCEGCRWKKQGPRSLEDVLECEFTRLAHAKKTLNMRKFPKREQKIIVAYKGDIKAIKDEFPSIGRL